MASGVAYALDISPTIHNVTNELRQLQDLLLFAEELDPSILIGCRDVLNRVRHTAWAVQQYGESVGHGKGTNRIGLIQGGEHIRTVCQLCNLLEADLCNLKIHLQDAQLFGLSNATQELSHRLREVIENYE